MDLHQERTWIVALSLAAPLSFTWSSYLKECLSELLGTYILVFIGSGSVVVVSLFPFITSAEALTFVALVFGCTVASIIIVLGRHSGAHVNPAISVASAVADSSKRRSLAPPLSSSRSQGRSSPAWLHQCTSVQQGSAWA